MTTDVACVRHFVTYSGVKLPLNLSTSLTDDELRNRITFYRAAYNAAGQMLKVEKMVYGEIESCHEYAYHPGGALREARLVMVAEETGTLMLFDEQGNLLSSETRELDEPDED